MPDGGAASARPTLPRLPGLGQVRTHGELHQRLTLSFDRISRLYPELDDYGPEVPWPGDRSGRILEALSVLGPHLGRRSARADHIVKALPRRLNERGYVGRLAPPGELHTDQLWGNWFQVLGLLAYYNTSSDERALTVARGIADGLFLPSLPYWAPYTYDFHWYPRLADHWTLDSHPGAGLASGGGLVHLWQATGRADYLQAARRVAELALGFDWRSGAHGHSALSLLINLADLYAATGERRYLLAAVEGHAWVAEHATSVNGEPYNLFMPRDTYMEGCGVGDWLVLNLKLWRTTGEVQYLDTAEAVLYNGLFHVQRPSGSFGCDADQAGGLTGEARFFEADWCCSMRGGRALGEVVRYLYAVNDEDVLVNFYQANEATLHEVGTAGAVHLVETTDYPSGGTVDIAVSPERAAAFGLCLRVPAWSGTAEVLVNDAVVESTRVGGYVSVRRRWQPGDRCQVRLPIGLRAYARTGFPAQHPGTLAAPTVVPDVRFYHGPLLLGADNLHNDLSRLSGAVNLLIAQVGDVLHLPGAAPDTRPNRFSQPGAHYTSLVVARPDQRELHHSVHLSPLSEHTGDPGFGATTRVRLAFSCGLVQDLERRPTYAALLTDHQSS